MLPKSYFHLTQLSAISAYKFGYAQIHFALESFHLTIELYLVTTTILSHNYHLSLATLIVYLDGEEKERKWREVE